MGRQDYPGAFVQDMFVFPGGKPEASDQHARAATELPRQTVERLTRSPRISDARARTLAVGVVRETFEETGLLLGAPGHVGDVEGEAWDSFRAAGHAPALDALHLVARAITPPPGIIRYHVRFFIADANRFQGEPEHKGELHDLAWYPLPEALKLPAIDPTKFVLREVGERYRHADAPTTDPGVALYSYRNGKPIPRYV